MSSPCDLAPHLPQPTPRLPAHRSQMILVADPPMEAFESLSVPHTSLLSIKSEAPRLFNAPRIQLEIRPTPGGGLPEAGSTRAEFRCAKGDKEPFLRFAAALDKTRERAVNKSRANPEDEFDLRK